MNIQEAKTYLRKFQNLEMKFSDLVKEKDSLREALTSVINSVILDSPKIEEIEPFNIECCLLHLKVKKIHILVGGNKESTGFFTTKQVITMQIFSDLDKRNYLRNNYWKDRMFIQHDSIKKTNFNFDYLSKKVEQLQTLNDETIENSKNAKTERKQRSEEIKDLQSQITEARAAISPLIELSVDKYKNFNLNINNIDDEGLDKLLKLLKEFNHQVR